MRRRIYHYSLATDQQEVAIGNGDDVGDNDFVEIKGEHKGGKVTLDSTGAMTVVVEILDGQGRTIPQYEVVFTSADQQTIDLEEIPFSHIRVNVTAHTDGALWATYQEF
ncbi:hypothetical protein MLD52_09135 [Puniceicoccaceae bacterium K14]|nr:hypothetical protein [Puniceicoccaceae bacterium K14]